MTDVRKVLDMLSIGCWLVFGRCLVGRRSAAAATAPKAVPVASFRRFLHSFPSVEGFFSSRPDGRVFFEPNKGVFEPAPLPLPVGALLITSGGVRGVNG